MLKSLLDRYSVERSFFIAELGSSHLGDLDLAVHLIDSFRDAGVRVFKTQHIIADEILHPKTGVLNLVGREVNLYETFKTLERDKDFYKKLKRYCDEKNLFFFASSFGGKSTEDLLDIGVEAMKVASPESNYVALLESFRESKRPVFLSTGVTKLEDVEESLRHLDPSKTALLHCLTEYPAPEEEMNLLLLPSLASYFNLRVGLSDHSLDPLFIPNLAFALLCLQGEIFILEKHATLDRTGSALDDQIALTPRDAQAMFESFENLRKSIKKELRFFEGIDPRRGLNPSQIEELVDGLSSLLREPKPRVKNALGSGVKLLAPSEEKNYWTTNRSYRALKTIKKGEKITKENVAFLRSEKNLKPGLSYVFDDFITKTKASVDISEAEAITLENIEKE